MNRWLLGLQGTVLLVGMSLIPESPFASASSHGGSEGNARRMCCPQCDCPMVRVCQVYEEMRKETDYLYCCRREPICIPPLTPLCPKNDRPPGDRHGHHGGEGHCCVREVHKLLKCAVTREVPVRRCNLAWRCPNCRLVLPETTSAPRVPPPSPESPRIEPLPEQSLRRQVP